MRLDWLKSPHKLFLFFLIAGAAAFANGLNHPLMIDDYVFFDEMGRNPRNLWINFIPDKAKVLNLEGPKTEVYYRPLALSVPKLVYWLVGGSRFAMHLFNLLLFVTAVWLLARLLGRLSGDMLFGTLTALFMLVHPINGIIVNYKTAGIFALQMIFMIMAADWTFKDKVSPGRQAGIIALFLAALFCHEDSFALPLYLLVISRIVLKDPWQRSLQRCGPIFTAAVIYFFLHMIWASLGENLFNKYAGYHMSIWEFVATWFSLQAWYIAKFFAPEGIVIWTIRPIIHTGAADWVVFGSTLWFLAVWTRKKYFPNSVWMQVGLWWFFIGMLLLGAGSLFNGNQLMIEPHWLLFACIGFFMVLADALILVLRGPLRIPVAIATAVLVLSWMSWGWAYNTLWNSEKNYCYYWLQENPSFNPVHMYIARAYFGEGNLEMAAKHYKLSLANQYPDYIMYSNLGSIALLEDKLPLARAYLMRALSIEPRCARALSSLGLVFVRMGDLNKAELCFKRSAQVNHYDSTSMRNLRLLYKYKYGVVDDQGRGASQVPLILQRMQ